MSISKRHSWDSEIFFSSSDRTSICCFNSTWLILSSAQINKFNNHINTLHHIQSSNSRHHLQPLTSGQIPFWSGYKVLISNKIQFHLLLKEFLWLTPLFLFSS
jgi:hypothetical protein